jgi:hypothetical protein
MTTFDVTRQAGLAAARSLLHELKVLEPTLHRIAALLPARKPEPEQHWWVDPGQPLPPNSAPDALESAAWRQLVRLGHRRLAAWRRLQWPLLELRLTCTQTVYDAAERLSGSVEEVGYYLHVLGPGDAALLCIAQLDVDAEAFVDRLREEQGLPALSTDD